MLSEYYHIRSFSSFKIVFETILSSQIQSRAFPQKINGINTNTNLVSKNKTGDTVTWNVDNKSGDNPAGEVKIQMDNIYQEVPTHTALREISFISAILGAYLLNLKLLKNVSM